MTEEDDNDYTDPLQAEVDGDALEARFPAMMARAFRGESQGLSGIGAFSFKVLENEKDGKVLVRLEDISFKTENRADKTYREMVGENAKPKGFEDDDDEDDGTDVA